MLQVNTVIYFYMFICISLLLFNIGYIVVSKRAKKRGERLKEKWIQIIGPMLEQNSEDMMYSKKHKRTLEKKLRNIKQLIAYYRAIKVKSQDSEKDVKKYLNLYYEAFQNLALYYSGRASMEKAYFAHVMCVCHPERDDLSKRLEEILLGYMDNTTIYCRENVLKALYIMGKEGPIEHAFLLLSDRELYHHPRLLSDGMMKYSGDKKALVLRLWLQKESFSESIQVAIVQFAAMVSGDFVEMFLKELENKEAFMEVKFAIIRYLGKYPRKEAQAVLLQYAQEEDNYFAVAACMALGEYPGEETERVLLNALHSKEWYIRKNAAFSLVKLGLSKKMEEKIRNSGDQYAQDMIVYMKGEYE